MSLREEIKQNRPFSTVAEEAMVSLARTLAILDVAPNKILKKAGISHPQYNVLRILRGSPEGLCRQEIGNRMVANVPDVTRLLDRMEESGLITRHRESEDRRYVTTRITEKGLDMLAQLEEPMRSALEQQIGHVSDEDLAALVRILEKLREPHVCQEHSKQAAQA